ncbi:MAG: ATP-dependent deoxyribonuclease subunit A [Acidobacteria bacterium]|nr:ATP-dependent deoxyribonuclease subunit A [Acidobacteriota bacterium]
MIIPFPGRRAAINDDEARTRIRHSLGESLLVEASAGTGKTSELVRRIVNVLASGAASIDRIAAVTFTNKAAGELKLRLRGELDRARFNAERFNDQPASRGALEHALEHLEEASIGTIHSFCGQILRERPVEARIDPAFQEMAEPEGSRLYRRAFRRWFERSLEAPSPALRRALSRLAWRDGWDTAAPMDQLAESGRRLIEWRDFPAAWPCQPFDREAAIDELAPLVQREGAGQRALVETKECAQWIARAEAGGARDYDAVESLLLKLLRDLRRVRRKSSEDLLQRLEAFRERADASLASGLRGEMQGLLDEYEQLKQRTGRIDFLDLLLRTRDLVRGNRTVREYLQRRYQHIFVDEFQDTDPLQAEILLLLAADDPAEDRWRQARPVPGKLFVVGDPKQSIYKFRRADLTLYREIRDMLDGAGAGVVRLSRGFRSVLPLQQLVNAAFEPAMRDDAEAGQVDYAPLEEHRPAVESQPAIVALPAPKPYGMRNISGKSIDECLPGTVAAYIDWLLNHSGWTVEEDGARVPIRPRHVCVLFRRFIQWGDDLSRGYVRSLEARGIPHLLVGSKSFHHREEVSAMRAALAAIEWPGDELSVYGTLRGALFAIPDALLLRYREAAGHCHPFRAQPEGDLFAPVRDAMETLAGLHRGRNHRPVAETVNLLLEATRAHAGFALRPAGHQVLANVHRIADLARQFELSGGISFRGFVEELEAQAEKAESAEAPIVEEGAEGVHLMTVHRAKGLEFPVVILADLTANLSARDPDRYIDNERGLCALRLMRCAPQDLLDHQREERARERAEGIRLAYVAATRARDLLVVTAVGDQPYDGWLSPLNDAIYPARGEWRQAQRAPGCPAFGATTVLERPVEMILEGEFSVKPGLHQPKLGGHQVVWWDPAVLSLEAESDFGLRHEEILAEGPASAAAQSRFDSWREQREVVRARGAQPSMEIISPSLAAAGPEAFPCEVTRVRAGRRPGKPSGKRFGTLVHAVLRDVDLVAGPEKILELVRMHARLCGATDFESSHAVHSVAGVLDHALIAEARAASRLLREFPVTAALEDGRVIDAVIDMAFENAAGWTILDFKTALDPRRLEAYENQVRWYALALARLTSAPVRAVLVEV